MIISFDKKPIVIKKRRKTDNKTLKKESLKIHKNHSVITRCSLTNGDSFIRGYSPNMNFEVEKIYGRIRWMR